ncbi:regulatory protein, luxR family [Nakamurella panacisegetis]|uniref:Regulatory protein, luxR family n=1 Tax=Nakamurella panacisegetis TaxID=1090615 RepID=A0A1H0RJ83_9ACTN|nr:AAA family ATPase [Nakamurella panacisegetis]SDP29470.1 regulatory protein, luxR family [Nakamurella panacisegetis]
MAGGEGKVLGSGPPVDRDSELAALAAVLDAAGGGAGESVLVEAAAGLGKSRLLEEAATFGHARGLTVIRARANLGDRDYPFGLILRLFEPFLVKLSADRRAAVFAGSAELAVPLLAPAGRMPTEGDGAIRPQAAVLHGLFWLVLNIAAQRPVLLTVDDVQWADEASLQFLLYLAERIEDLPVALVAAARPRRSPEAAVLTALRYSPAQTRLSLAPLSVAGMTELVHRSRPAMDPVTCAACVEVANGNPFYLRETLLSLDDAAPDFTAERIRDLGGASLARVALFRLLRLGPGSVSLAGALAVLGEQSPLAVVAQLAGLSTGDAATAADELADEQLISSGVELEFLHPLIGQSIYAEIPPARRAVDHAAAAVLLRRSGAPAERVATQLLASPAGMLDWAVATFELAAERAMAQGAPHSAARYLSRAVIEAGGDTARRVALLIALGCAQTAAGLPASVENLRAALAEQRDPMRWLEVARLLSRAYAHSGEHQVAAQVLEEALERVGPGTEQLRAGLLADYLTYSAFSTEQRQRSITRVTPLLREPPDNSSPESRLILAALAMRSGQSWQPNPQTIDLAYRAWDSGALLATEGPDGSGWLMTAWAYELAEDSPATLSVCAAAIAAARVVGSIDAFAAGSYFHGYASLRLGRIMDAEADADQAIEVAGNGRHRYLVSSLVLRANVSIERDDLAAAEQALRAAEKLTDSRSMLDLPWLLDSRARLELARHRPSAALEHFQQAGAHLMQELKVEHTVLPWRSGAAMAALAVGDTAQAQQLVSDILAVVERKDALITRGRGLRVQGLLLGGSAGLALLADSAELLAGTSAELEYGYSLAELGAALRRAGHRVQARRPLTLANAITARLGAELLGRRVRDELAAAGARPPAPANHRTLTPSEHRVADLALQGLTNNEIAQALFVTPKTVEYHLRQIYQRLGIGRRHELGAAMALIGPDLPPN